jgi:Zn-finger nucleic acid-binding protein
MHTVAIAQMPHTTAPAAPALNRASVDAGGTTGKLFCPRCEAPVLQEHVRDGVSIDVCRECRGTWLDCGELERLIWGSMHGCNRHPRPALRHVSAREYAALFWDEV